MPSRGTDPVRGVGDASGTVPFFWTRNDTLRVLREPSPERVRLLTSELKRPEMDSALRITSTKLEWPLSAVLLIPTCLGRSLQGLVLCCSPNPVEVQALSRFYEVQVFRLRSK